MSEDFKIPTLEEVFKATDDIFELIDIVDNTYKIQEGNFLMKYFQNRGMTLRQVFIRDVINWLCFLAWADDQIDPREVLFINGILGLNLTQLDVFEVIEDLKTTDLSILPPTFALFIEHESKMDNEDGEESIAYILLSYFFITGSYLIAIDEDINDGEVIGFLAYIDKLKYNIDTFNLNSLHKYMLDNI